MFAPSGATLPTFHNLLDALPGIADRSLAKHLGVSLRTFQRWKATNNPPKVVCLALWVETYQARATLDVQLQNEVAHWFAMHRTAESRVAALTAQIAALEAERAVGGGLPANSPFFALA